MEGGFQARHAQPHGGADAGAGGGAFRATGRWNPFGGQDRLLQWSSVREPATHYREGELVVLKQTPMHPERLVRTYDGFMAMWPAGGVIEIRHNAGNPDVPAIVQRFLKDVQQYAVKREDIAWFLAEHGKALG
jgi:hypothetical protein